MKGVGKYSFCTFLASKQFVFATFSHANRSSLVLVRILYWPLPILILLASCSQPQPDNKLAQYPRLPVPQLKRLSQEQYGIDVAAHQVIQDSFPRDMLLTDVLQSYGVGRAIIDTIDSRSGKEFDVRKMRAGHPFTILRNTTSGKVDFFIYEETEENFFMIDFRQGVDISRGKRNVHSEPRSLNLPISTTLYEAVKDQGADVALVKSLEKIFAWDVNFFQLDSGDYCQVIFEERFIDGRFIGVGEVLAARFHQGGQDYYAFYRKGSRGAHYYDEHGKHIRNAYLASPLAPEADHSPLTPQVEARLKEQRFLAPSKTAVIAVGDGELISIKQKGNSRSLLLRHTNVYSSQYLHMGQLAPHIEQAQAISQGDTLGYVGQLPDGLGFGVGLRFWNQGKPAEPPVLQGGEDDFLIDASEENVLRQQIRQWQRQLDRLGSPVARG